MVNELNYLKCRCDEDNGYFEQDRNTCGRNETETNGSALVYTIGLSGLTFILVWQNFYQRKLNIKTTKF